MPVTRRLRIAASTDPAFEPGIAGLHRKMHLPDPFPPGVEAAARIAAAMPQCRVFHYREG